MAFVYLPFVVYPFILSFIHLIIYSLFFFLYFNKSFFLFICTQKSQHENRTNWLLILDDNFNIFLFCFIDPYRSTLPINIDRRRIVYFIYLFFTSFILKLSLFFSFFFPQTVVSLRDDRSRSLIYHLEGKFMKSFVGTACILSERFVTSTSIVKKVRRNDCSNKKKK